MRYLSDDDLRSLSPAETATLATPIPTQMISNGEFTPLPQTPRAAARRARDRAAGRGAGAPPRHESPPVPGVERRHVGRLRGHEHRVRTLVQRQPRRSRHAGHGRRPRARARRPVHLRLPDAFRARRLRPGRHHRPGAIRQAVLEPGAGEREVARPHEVRELREGDLRRQRHQGGAAVGLAGRRSVQPVPDQRPDRRGAHRGQYHRALAPHAGAFHHPAHERWLARRGRPLHRDDSSPTAGRATPSAIRSSSPRRVRTGGWTTRSASIRSTRSA